MISVADDEPAAASSASYPRVVGIRIPGAATGLCVVLDLDECLLHTFGPGHTDLLQTILTDSRYLEVRSRLLQIELHDADPTSPKGTGKVENIWGVFRPHLRLFMQFLFAHCYTVCFWTAGIKEYADACIEKICKGIKQPYIILTRDDIETLPSREYHKPLAKVFQLDPKGIKPRLTLFIDDKVSNFISAPDNGIEIPPYKPAAAIRPLQTDDICLLQIRQWMLTAIPEGRDTDVRKLNKRAIFQQPLRQLAPSKTQVYSPLAGTFRTPLYVFDLPAAGWDKLIEV